MFNPCIVYCLLCTVSVQSSVYSLSKLKRTIVSVHWVLCSVKCALSLSVYFIFQRSLLRCLIKWRYTLLPAYSVREAGHSCTVCILLAASEHTFALSSTTQCTSVECVQSSARGSHLACPRAAITTQSVPNLTLLPLPRGKVDYGMLPTVDCKYECNLHSWSMCLQ